MKKIRFFSSALALGAMFIGTLPMFAQTQTISLTTSKAAGQKLTFIVNKPNISVDWGDGTQVVYKTDTIVGEIKDPTKIKVYGNEVWDMFNCSNCELSALNVTQAPKLRSLYCSNNNIQLLFLTKSADLLDLDCSNNALTSLSTVNTTAMSSLNVSGNKLTGSFTTKSMPNLAYLNISNNAITALSTMYSTELDMLICNNNKLASLDLSKNEKLGSLICGNNNLSTINVPAAGLTVLTDLICDNNKLATLNLSQSSNLSNISCSNNQLTKIDFFTNLKTLYSYLAKNNQLTFTSLQSASPATYLDFEPQAAYQIPDMPYWDSTGSYMFVSNYSGDGLKSLDLNTLRYDADGKPYVMTWNAISVVDGKETTLARGTGKDYTYSSGKFTFLKPFSQVYITMKHLKYPDLVLRTQSFAVVDVQPTGINSVADNAGLTINVQNGQLSVSSATTTGVKVYSMDGKMVWSGKVDASGVTLSLGKGVYLVNNKKVSL